MTPQAPGRPSSPVGAAGHGGRGTALAKLERVARDVAEIATVPEAVELIDLAEAARVYARQAKLGTGMVNHATTIRVKAERRLADLVDEGQAKGQIATKESHGRGPQGGHVRATDKTPPVTLDDLGVDRRRLDESRKIRDKYTDTQIDELAAEATAKDEPITRTSFVTGTAHVSNNSGQNEWYTPPVFLIAARATFWDDETCGEDCVGNSAEPIDGCDCPPITTDPASSTVAQQTVQAKYFFTAEDDGLAQKWVGNVWMNPPYAQPLIGRFVDKLISELDAGNTRQAIVLVNNATETEWGQKLIKHAAAVCFPKGRIRFLDPAGNPGGAPLQGQMIAYLTSAPYCEWWDRTYAQWDEKGQHISDQFAEAYAHLGPVMICG